MRPALTVYLLLLVPSTVVHGQVTDTLSLEQPGMVCLEQVDHITFSVQDKRVIRGGISDNSFSYTITFYFQVCKYYLVDEHRPTNEALDLWWNEGSRGLRDMLWPFDTDVRGTFAYIVTALNPATDDIFALPVYGVLDVVYTNY